MLVATVLVLDIKLSMDITLLLLATNCQCWTLRCQYWTQIVNIGHNPYVVNIGHQDLNIGYVVNIGYKKCQNVVNIVH